MLGTVLKERTQLNNKFIQRLTEKFAVARTGEHTREECDEVEESSEDGTYLESDLPPPLEKLAVEVKAFMTSAHLQKSLSFAEGGEEADEGGAEYSHKCHSDYSEFEDESFGERCEKDLSLIHICRCRRSTLCRSRWSPYH
eukprot:TRINITY_DN9458_c0_g1_i6.p2 TRINITY_DN9458_c0_g1~~TRINITY_DN9458_c0_g1_i6.p2  ORF type:complete len:141 (-),score=40.93 TRINITY_DN9458_c0_g1_i6:21-443(-)